MKTLIVSGGTGGHIYPGIALAQEIRRKDPSAEILFVGSEEGLEKDLIGREGYPVKLIKARALLRKLSYKAISAPFVSIIGFWQSLRILKEYSPKVVISTGGYASLPVVLSAKLLSIPIFLLEQNTLPGAVNRLCSRLAKKVFLAFPETIKYLEGVVVGNPVRREIVTADRASARKKFNLQENETAVLIMGGSQGARQINETVFAALRNIPARVKILHIVGQRDYKDVKAHNYRAFSYIYNMAEILAAADVVISRAGATAIAEFLVRGLPMILVPFPFAAEDHQRLNARAIADKGGAIVVENAAFTPKKFSELVSAVNLDYDKMKKVNLALAQPQAAERIVEYIYD